MVQKELCLQRESPAGSMQGGAGGSLEGGVCVFVCIRACGYVSLCAVSKARSAIFNIPVSLDLEYQNNLSGSIQMLLPLHTFHPPPFLLHLLCSVFSLPSPHTYGPLFQLLFLGQN